MEQSFKNTDRLFVCKSISSLNVVEIVFHIIYKSDYISIQELNLLQFLTILVYTPLL